MCRGFGTIFRMVLVILIWLAIVVAAVLFVLRLARGESHEGLFTEHLYERSNPKPQSDRVPRVGGTVPSFAPTGTSRRFRADDPIPEVEQTMDNPVYINQDGSVVEFKSLRKSHDHAARADSATGGEGSGASSPAV